MPQGTILSFFGALFLLYLFIKIATEVSVFLRPSKLSKYLHQRKDSRPYAFITAATDGMGLAFTREMCRQGFNIVLHGRNPEKLQRRVDQLQREFPQAKFRTWTCDAGEMVPGEVFSDLASSLEDINLTVLINNVGGIHHLPPGSYIQSYRSYTTEKIDNVINLNARFMTHLTRALLPILERNTPSLILNLSSLVTLGIPFVSIYGGSKAYVETFSTALDMEMKMQNRDIEVLALKVGEVKSAVHDVPTSFFIPDGADFVRSALGRVGCGRSVVMGYWTHWLQVLPLRLIPEWVRKEIICRELKARGPPKGRHLD